MTGDDSYALALACVYFCYGDGCVVVAGCDAECECEW